MSSNGQAPSRLRGLPRRWLLGAEYPVAVTCRARLLGLALLDRDSAGSGLAIPGCRSVHTFGMRFPLDLHFIGRDGEPVRVCRSVPPRRFVVARRARMVVEVPAAGLQTGSAARA